MKKFFWIFIIFLFFIPASAKDFRYNQQTMQVYEVETDADRAIETYTKLISELEKIDSPKNKLSDLYLLRGKQYESNKQYSEALLDYKKSIEYNCKNSKALLASSEIKNYYGDYSGALQDIKSYSILKPDVMQAYMIAGALNSTLKKYDAAIIDYTQAIKLKNKNPEAFYWRGLCEIATNKTNKGLQDLDFAKRQYLQLDNVQKYKEVSDLINLLTNKETNIKPTYQQHQHIESKSPNIPLLPMQDNSFQILQYLDNKTPAQNNINLLDLYMLLY